MTDPVDDASTPLTGIKISTKNSMLAAGPYETIYTADNQTIGLYTVCCPCHGLYGVSGYLFCDPAVMHKFCVFWYPCCVDNVNLQKKSVWPFDDCFAIY